MGALGVSIFRSSYSQIAHVREEGKIEVAERSDDGRTSISYRILPQGAAELEEWRSAVEEAVATQLSWQVEVDCDSGFAVAPAGVRRSSSVPAERRELHDFKEPANGCQCQQLLEYSPLNGVSSRLRNEVLCRFGPARSTAASAHSVSARTGTNEEAQKSHDRAIGALVGLVVGDAVGDVVGDIVGAAVGDAVGDLRLAVQAREPMCCLRTVQGFRGPDHRLGGHAAHI